MLRATLLLIVVVSAVAHAIACMGACVAVDPDVPCESPLDCELREACIDGACIAADAGVGEGEGEGEPGDEAKVIEGVCLRLAQCQGGSPAECNEALQAQLDDLRRQGTDACARAAEALVEFFACAQSVSCADLTNDPSAVCPIVIEAQQLQNECFGGEGEGE